MKKITNKTLGGAGIIILFLSYITSATDSNGVVIFPALGFLVFVSYLIFIIISSYRLWKNLKNLVLFFIIISILSLGSEVFIILNISPISAILSLIIRLISLITSIYVIIKLFKIKYKTIVEPEVINIQKRNWGEIFGTGIIILIYVIGGIGWITNLVKFVRLDFQTPYKAEVFRGIGLSPLGAIIGYLPIKDGNTIKENNIALPVEYLKDKENLTNSFSFINDAYDITQNSENIDALAETKMQQNLKLGVEAGNNVSDAFLDYLNPELKIYYKEKYLKGAELFLSGIQNSNKFGGVSDQVKGLEFQKEWSSWWGVNKDPIIKKVFPN